MKKVLESVLTIIFIIILFISCGPAKSKKAAKDYTVGFVQMGYKSSWRSAETDSIRDTAREREIKLIYIDAQNKQELQIKALRNFIANSIDGIILVPIIKTGWDRVLIEARDAGIPVVLIDRGITVSDDSLYTTLIKSDFVLQGIKAGKWLSRKLNYTGNIVELKGTEDLSSAINRKRGFESIIKKYPGIKIIKSESADFKESKGKEIMKKFLIAEGKNIDALFAHNDEMAIGAIKAIEEYGLRPGLDIIIISIDGIRKAFEAMIQGKLNCTVECNPLFGPAAFNALARAIAGEKLPKWIKQDDKVFPQEIADEIFPTRTYY